MTGTHWSDVNRDLMKSKEEEDVTGHGESKRNPNEQNKQNVQPILNRGGGNKLTEQS